ncbi:MAG: hypothetical protein ABIS67_03940 [Candidatus Eisenbacteria bacterium]
MNDPSPGMPAPAYAPDLFDSIDTLRAGGFDGFATVNDLIGSRCAEVPVTRGVYLVVREPALPPRFMPSSSAGLFRGQKASVKVEVLTGKWVADAIVLYVGQAGGTGVRSQLQQRIKRYIRFGSGKSVNHWNGRYVWQLADHRKLRFAWLAEDQPAGLEARLLEAFEARYAALPFANLRTESDDDDADNADIAHTAAADLDTNAKEPDEA